MPEISYPTSETHRCRYGCKLVPEAGVWETPDGVICDINRQPGCQAVAESPRRACVFCERITNGDYDEGFRYGGDLQVRFEPLNPVTPGHMLFVPAEHVVDASSFLAVTGETFMAAAEYAQRMREEQDLEFNLITSGGPAATQSVFHLHIHYVPRRYLDGLALPWTGQQRDA